MSCPNLNNPEHVKIINTLTYQTAIENLAFKAWEYNKQKTLEFAPNGKESLLLKSIKTLYPDLDLRKQFVLKSYIYSDEFINKNGNWFRGQKYSQLELDENGEPIMDVHEATNSIYFRNQTKTREQVLKYLDVAISMAQKSITDEQLERYPQIELYPIEDEDLLSIITAMPKKGEKTTRIAHNFEGKIMMNKNLSKKDTMYGENKVIFSKDELQQRFDLAHKRTKNKYNADFDILVYNDVTRVISIHPQAKKKLKSHITELQWLNQALAGRRESAIQIVKDIAQTRLTALTSYRDKLLQEKETGFKSILTEEEELIEDDIYDDGFKTARSTNADRLKLDIIQRIDRLQSKKTKNLSVQDQDILQLRIDRLKNDLLLLDKDLSYENIATVATRQIEEVEAIIGNSDTLNYTDLLNALTVITNWKWENSMNLLTDGQKENKFNKFYLLFNKVSSKAEELSLVLTDKIRKQVLSDIKNKINPSATIDQLLEIRAANMAINLTLDNAKQESPLVQYIDLLLKQANTNQLGQLNVIMTEVESMFSLLGGNTNYEKYWQTNEHGDKTGRMVDAHSSKWYTYISGRKASRNRHYRAYNNGYITGEELHRKLQKLDEDFRKNVIVLDNDALFNGQKPKMDSKYSRQDYIDYLHAVLGKEIAERAIEEAKLKNTQYHEDLKRWKQTLEDSGEKNVDAELEKWMHEHSPYIYVENIYGQKKKYSVRNEGYRYAITIPKAQNLKGQKTGFYDDAYLDIMSDSDTAEFYIRYRELMNRLMSVLPETITSKLPHNMLPDIQKSLLDEFISSGLFSISDKISDKLLSFITSNEVAELVNRNRVSSARRDPETNKPSKSIPLMFLGNSSTNERSMDLHKMIQLFAGMVINHQFKSEVEDKILILNKVLHDAREIEVDSRLRRTIDATTNKLVSYKGGLEELKRAVQYEIDANLYSQKKPTDKGTKMVISTLNPLVNLHKLSDKFQFLNSIEAIKNKKRRLELESLAETLEIQYDNEEITKEDYDSQIAIYEEEYKTLGGKHLSYVSIAETAIKWTQLKALGLNAPAGLANLLFGIASNFTHANGRIEFDTKSLLKSQALMFKLLFSRNPSKIAALVKKYDILFDVIDSRYGTKETKFSNISGTTKEKVIRKVSNFEPYMFQTKGEYFIQATSFIAHMMFTKVEGTNISVFDAYNEDGTWNSELFDEKTNNNWNEILKSAEDTNEFTKLRNRSIEMNKMLHGNYDPNSPILIKRYVLGRMLMQFRSWIPEGVANRFLSERYNAQLGRTTKGRYITYGELGIFGSLEVLGKQLMYYNNPEKAFESLIDPKTGKINERDMENMRRNLAEIVMWGNLIMLKLLLGLALSDDDDDNIIKRRVLTVIYNKVHRAMQDIYFYIDPTSAYDVLSLPLPAVRAFTDIGKAMSRTWQEMFDDNYNGYSPAYYWGKNLPYVNQWNNLNYVATHRVD